MVQAAPTTLKAAFLEPMASDMGGHVMLELFARTDADFMAMFTGEPGAWLRGPGRAAGAAAARRFLGACRAATRRPHRTCTRRAHACRSPTPCTAAAGAMAALQGKRDALHRRAEGLVKCKTEFQELAKCL